MAVIDADCHVIENERTWELMEGPEGSFKPIPLTSDTGRRFLAVAGELRNDRSADGTKGAHDASIPHRQERETLSGRAQTTQAIRNMQDIDGRLRHMDELGVDIQVLYPTMGLFQLANPRPGVEPALSRSYNRWLGDIWQRARGRLALDLGPALTRHERGPN